MASWFFQKSAKGLWYETVNKDVDTIIERVKNCASKGGDPVILVTKDHYTNFETDRTFKIGHVVVAYGLRGLNDKYRVYVYDCDQIGIDNIDNMYIDFMKDDEGKLSGEWEFDLRDGNVFGDTNSASISYIDSITLDDVFRVEWPDNAYLSFIDGGVFAITDSSGQTVTYNNGCFDNESAWLTPLYDNCLNLEYNRNSIPFLLSGHNQYTITGPDSDAFSMNVASATKSISINTSGNATAVLDITDDCSGLTVNGEKPAVTIETEKHFGNAAIHLSEMRDNRLVLGFGENLEIKTEGIVSIEITKEDGNTYTAEVTGEAYIDDEDELYVMEDDQYRRIELKLKGSNILTLPSALERMEAEAFSGLERVDRIVIPASVTYIDDSTFAGTDALLSVTPDSYADRWAHDHGYVNVEVLGD